MADDPDGVFLGADDDDVGPCDASGLAEDGMYLADSDDDASLGGPARRAQGRPRAPLRHGTFGAFLVARSPAGAG